MIKKMNNLSDKIVEYRNEVMNSLLTFDLLQAHLKPAHIQNCCFEDFEYVYRQALSIEEKRQKSEFILKELGTDRRFIKYKNVTTTQITSVTIDSVVTIL